MKTEQDKQDHFATVLWRIFCMCAYSVLAILAASMAYIVIEKNPTITVIIVIVVVPVLMLFAYEDAIELDEEFERYSNDPEKRSDYVHELPANTECKFSNILCSKEHKCAECVRADRIYFIRPIMDLTNEPPLDLTSSSYENREATQKETNHISKYFNDEKDLLL